VKDRHKLYVIKKFVKATSVADAIRQDKKAPVDSVWIDDDWAKGNAKPLADAIGFTYQQDETEEEN
jgi:hypothetical protein